MLLPIGVAMLMVGVCALVVGEWRRLPTWRFVAKPIASFGFLFVALCGFPFVAPAQQWIFAGLVLGAAGDLCLLGAGKRAFLLGLLSFLVGHICYAIAFSCAPMEPVELWLPGLSMLVVFVGLLRWAWPFLGKMKAAVVAYMLVIGTMVTCSFGENVLASWTVGATLFAFSDFFVLRQRFIRATASNRIIGLPVYYAAQALFAASLQT